MTLNISALQECEGLLSAAVQLRIAVTHVPCGTRLIDCGVSALGGMEAGRRLAEVGLAGLARVAIAPGRPEIWPGPSVILSTDQPVAACLASQYAGWPINEDGYFAMASGPMRAARGREPLFEKIGYREQPTSVIGVLESGRLPPNEVCQHIADQCDVQPQNVTLLVAPTSSLAGTVQVVSRSTETALHKMHELGFDVARVKSAYGVAPLPPVAANDLQGIGRTNDAVLYGSEVTLWVTGDDASLTEFGPKIPSDSAADHGQPFACIFDKYERDFYKIDPLLFSPAVVTLVNLDTGRCFRFGRVRPDVIHQSFTS